MKRLIMICLILAAAIDAMSQDLIIRKDGKKLKTKIVEINDIDIKYRDYNDPGGIIFTIDRALISEVKFEHGTKIKEEGPNMDPAYYIDDRVNNLKVNFTSLGADWLILTYERSIDIFSSWEASVKLPGLGAANEGEELSGMGLSAAYKLKLGSVFKKRDAYRPKHLLAGSYIRPGIAYTYLKTKGEINSFAGAEELERRFLTYGLDFGWQWIIKNRISLDLYMGWHYYSGGIDYPDIQTDTGITAPEVRGGDMIGGGNNAISFGFRVGYVFGTKQQKRKR